MIQNFNKFSFKFHYLRNCALKKKRENFAMISNMKGFLAIQNKFRVLHNSLNIKKKILNFSFI